MDVLHVLPAENATQLEHLLLERVLRALWKFVTPHALDEDLGRHDFAGIEKERREQGPLPRAAHVQRRPLAAP